MENNTNPTPENTVNPDQTNTSETQPLPAYPNPSNDTGELPSAFSLFKPSIEALKLNVWTYLGIYGLLAVMGGLLGFASTPTNPAVSAVDAGETIAVNGTLVVFGIMFFILALVLSPAVTYIQLQSAKGNKVTIEQALKTGMKYVLRYLGLSLLVGLSILVGLILFIVPGIIMIRRYFLSSYYLVDQDLGIQEAMRRSASDTKQQSGKVWGVIGVTILCGLPAIVPFIGTIASGVLQLLYSFAPALRYFQIKEVSATNHSDNSTATDPSVL